MPAAPAPAGRVHTFEALVRDEDCDALGHMNVQHYFRIISDSMFVLMARLGLSEADIARRRRSFAVVRAETDFRRELRPGQAMTLETRIGQMGEKVFVFHHRLLAQPAGEVAMTTDYHCVMLDLDRRRAVAVPDDIRAAAAGYRSSPHGQPGDAEPQVLNPANRGVRGR